MQGANPLNTAFLIKPNYYTGHMHIRSGGQGAAIVGSGPNGLAAAVTLARAGIPVTVFEGYDTIGGGTRTEETVLPGVLHDVCSAIHPMAFGSRFFAEFGLQDRVEFVVPEVSYANPLDGTASPDGLAALAFRDLETTVKHLGRDGLAYRRFYELLLDNLDGVLEAGIGGAMLRVPGSISGLMRLGIRTLEQGTPLWNLRFREAFAPALITGVAAHSIGKMPRLSTSAVGLVLGALGHAGGYPVPVGGSSRIAQALLDDLVEHGGTVVTGTRVTSMGQLDSYDTIIFDTSARALDTIAGDALPDRYRKSLKRQNYGNGVTKVDYVLDGPIPWRDERVHDTATVHLGGTRDETAYAEAEVAAGRHADHPYVLLAQPDSFDTGRNPHGQHAIWSYTHVPHGSTVDVTETVTRQIERFAPGFRDRIIASHTTTADELSRYNPNYVGGDISSGAVTLKQLLARPTLSSEPWRTPAPGIYLCSSATPPGPGVHGLAGWYAALSALKHEYGLNSPSLRG